MPATRIIRRCGESEDIVRAKAMFSAIKMSLKSLIKDFPNLESKELFVVAQTTLVYQNGKIV